MSATAHDQDRPSPELIRAVADVCWKNSEYELVRGGRGRSYFDVDDLYGDKRDRGAEEALDLLVKRIEAIHKESPLRAVVLVERDSGPIGMIASRHWFAERVKLPFLTLRPRRRIRKMALKGGELKPGDCVAIVTDVATSGGTIAGAAETIMQLGGRIAAAISLFDREEGAKDMLAQMDVPFVSILSKPDFQTAEQVHK
jgi:orotate phosphoribosyltransferase